MFSAEKSSSDRRNRFYKLCLGACTLLLYYAEHVKGVVEISPPVVAPVCQVGDQLELTCNTSFALHTWQLTVISENGAAMTYMRSVQSIGPTGLTNTQLLTINSTMLTFSRLSTPDDLPLISRLIISNVSEGLNGVEIRCTDAAMSDSATTTIHIIGDTQISTLSVQLQSEQFSSDRVTAVLEWTLSNSLSQYPQLLQNVSVSVVPDLEVETLLIGRTSVRLTLLYNTLYNVNIIQPAMCEQLSQAAYIELNYRKCCDPLTLANDSVIVDGYEDPALEGENIIFSCRDGLTLIGPNSATCMGNGEWEPDLREVNCSGASTKMPSTDTDSASSDSLVLEIVFGVLAAMILIAIVIIAVIIATCFLNRKGVCKFQREAPDHVGTGEEHAYSQLNRPNFKVGEFHMNEETQNSNYAEVQCIPLQSLPLKSDFDDSNVEYAKLVNQEEVSTSQVPQTKQDNCPPVNLDNLLVQLRPQVGPKWYQFGEAAEIEQETLDKLAGQCSPQDCIVEMFDYWLRSHEKILTWKDVAEVLKTIGLIELGLDIERVHTTGKLPIVVDMNYIPKLDTEESELPPPLPPRELSPSLLNKEPPPPVLPPKPGKQVA